MDNVRHLSYRKTVVLSFFVYFFSYAMRLDYSASLVALVADLGITNTAASIAVTGSFITYGLGQIFFGFIGDKISTVKMISLAMLGTIIVNFLVSFCSSMVLITVLWCFNGIFQAMIWPPLTRFLAEKVGNKKYSEAITAVSLSAAAGTIFVYLLVPAILNFTIWRNVFRCMALFGFLIMGLWTLSTRNISANTEETVKAEVQSQVQHISVLLIISMSD